ncbi:hypothetical protein F4604DRAFT_1915975 [Suillus subluteus]|nr:hypothetical protein F4604DRAFT_1915975 [Suillus subluteus]
MKPHCKATELVGEISASWNTIGGDDRKAVTEEAMELLEKRHINKCTGVNNVPINAFHNTRITLKSISDESLWHCQLEQDAIAS